MISFAKNMLSTQAVLKQFMCPSYTNPLLGESWEIAHTDGKYSLVKFDAEKKELQKALLPDPKDNYLIEYDSSGVAMLKDDDKVTACQDVVDEILESDGSTGRYGLKPVGLTFFPMFDAGPMITFEIT